MEENGFCVGELALLLVMITVLLPDLLDGNLTKPVFISAKSILSRKSISHLGRPFMNFWDISHH